MKVINLGGRFALFSVLLITSDLYAQVSGTVYDGVSGDPLIAASPLVSGTTVGVVTDVEGRYRLNTVPEGRQTIIFSYIGYENDSTVVDIGPDTNIDLDASLQPAGFTSETVVVTSQRQGQNAAINQQVKANTIVNVVSAERIRELPDENAAESVSRLPGISVRRSGGEGQRVNIRGLSPKFSAVALDGVRIPATGQGRAVFQTDFGSGGGSNPSVDDRSVDLSMISSDALAGIEVYKSLTPDQDGDAIGGRVNFVSAKAPRLPKVYLTALGGTNHYHGSYDNLKLSGTYSRRLVGQKLGIIVTGAYNTIDRSSDNTSINYAFQSEPVLDGFNLSDNITRRRRYNASFALDYDLGRDHNIFLSSLFGRTSTDNEYRSFSIRPRTNNGGTSAGTGGGTINLYNVSLTGRHPFKAVSLDWKATFVQTTDENEPGYGYGFGAFNPFAGNEIPQSNVQQIYERFRFDPAFYSGGGPGGEGITKRDDKNYIGQINAKRQFRFERLKLSGFFKTGVKVQVKDRTRRSFNQTFLPQSWTALYPQLYPEEPFFQNGPAALPFVDQDFDLSDFFDGQYPLAFSVRPEEAERLFNDFRQFRRSRINQGLSDYDANERIYATYLMTDVNIGTRLNVVGGVRYERSVNDYVANEIINYREGHSGSPDYNPVIRSGRVNELTSDQEYGEWLPMVNMKINILENQDNSNGLDLRLAATKALTRPDFRNLTPFIDIDQANFTIERTQPDLLPTTAWNYDAFLTFFNNKFGLFTIGGFYKELSGVDFPTAKDVDPDFIAREFGEKYPSLLNVGGISLNEPQNSPEKAFIRGGEIEIQANLSWLPSPFDGLIFYGNVSLIESEITLPIRKAEFNFDCFCTVFIDSSRVASMPGQSNTIANVSVGYDKGRFSGRATYAFQGSAIDFIGPNSGLDGYIDDYGRLDITAKFKILENLSLMVNVNNATNRFDRTVFGINRLQGSANIYGAMTWVGLRYTATGRQRPELPD